MGCPPRAQRSGEMRLCHRKTGEQDREMQKDQTLEDSPHYVDSRNTEQTYREQTGVEMASEAQGEVGVGI